MCTLSVNSTKPGILRTQPGPAANSNDCQGVATNALPKITKVEFLFTANCLPMANKKLAAFTSKYQLPIHVYHPIFQTLSNIYSSTTITPSTLSPEQHFSLERVLNFSTSYNSSNPFQNQTLPESFCSLMHRMLFERPMDLHGLSQEEKDDLAEHHWFDDVEEDCFSRRQKGSTEMFLLNGKKSAAPVMFLVCTTDYDQMDIDLCAGIEDGIEAVWEDELEVGFLCSGFRSVHDSLTTDAFHRAVPTISHHASPTHASFSPGTGGTSAYTGTSTRQPHRACSSSPTLKSPPTRPMATLRISTRSPDS